MLEATAGAGIALAFQQVPEAKVGKNRMHFDLFVDDLDESLANALSLGATLIEANEQDGVKVRVLADPEGNEFCLVLVPSPPV